jgi:hypothetical protein
MFLFRWHPFLWPDYFSLQINCFHFFRDISQRKREISLVILLVAVIDFDGRMSESDRQGRAQLGKVFE